MYSYEGKDKKQQGDFWSFLHRISNFNIAVPLGIVMIFLWLNGTGFWGPYWESNTALAYMLMFGFILSLTRNSSLVWLTKTNFKVGVSHFFIGFLMMFAGLIGLNQFLFHGSLGASSVPVAALYPSIAITCLYVAPVEETIFRGVMKEYIGDWKLYFIPLGIVLTSAAFAFTHYAVYQGQIMPIWWAFIMGCVFYMATNFRPTRSMGKMGVPGAIGMHSAYNLFILGILSGGIV